MLEAGVISVFPSLQTSRYGRRRALNVWAVMAVVCLALLAMLAVAQVTHAHATNTDADHCQLCIVMHSVVPAMAATALLALVYMAQAAPMREVRAISRYWHAQLFIRPPPLH